MADPRRLSCTAQRPQPLKTVRVTATALSDSDKTVTHNRTPAPAHTHLVTQWYTHAQCPSTSTVFHESQTRVEQASGFSASSPTDLPGCPLRTRSPSPLFFFLSLSLSTLLSPSPRFSPSLSPLLSSFSFSTLLSHVRHTRAVHAPPARVARETARVCVAVSQTCGSVRSSQEFSPSFLVGRPLDVYFDGYLFAVFSLGTSRKLRRAWELRVRGVTTASL